MKATRAPIQVRIREATLSDWPALWSIIAAVIRTGDTYTLPPNVPEQEAQAYWMGTGLVTYVADTPDGIVGTYAMRANQPGLGSHVANAGYMVRPDCAGRGVGTQLAEHSLDVARHAGFRAMQFNAVVSTNERAVTLWKRMGFTVVGTIPEGYRHARHGYVDLFVMFRHL